MVVVTGSIAPDGVRTFTTTLLPFLRDGRATDKFFDALIVTELLLATVTAVRFSFEVVVERNTRAACAEGEAEGEGDLVGETETCGRGEAAGLGNNGVFSGGITVDGVGDGVGLGDVVLGGDGITRGGGGAPPPPPKETTPPPPPPAPPPLGADVGAEVTSIGEVG